MTATHTTVSKAPSNCNTFAFDAMLGATGQSFTPYQRRSTLSRAAAAPWLAGQFVPEAPAKTLTPLGETLRAVALVVLLMLALVCTSLLLTSQPASARQLCGERGSILKQLSDRYSEAPQAMGLSADGTVVEVLVSPAGSWTILISHPNQLTCLAANGKHWETMPKIAMGPSA